MTTSKNNEMKTYNYGLEVMNTSPNNEEEENHIPIYYEINNPSKKITGLVVAINDNPFLDSNIEKGQKIWEKEVENGLENGYSRIWNDNGQLVEETIYKKGIINGQKMWLDNGKLWADYCYDNCKPHLFKDYTTDGFLWMERIFKNGNLIKNIRFLRGGAIVESTFDDNDYIQTIKVFHRNGRIKETIKDGILNGVFESWYENGNKLSKICYDNGQLNGDCNIWYENGQLLKEEKYKNGLKNGTFKEWFENGKLYSEATYNDNILEDVMKQWYSNGQLRFHNFYNNGKLDGVNRSWNEKGQLKSERTYKNGVKDGIETFFVLDVNRKIETTYKNGKKVLFKCWENGKLIF